MTTFGVAYMLFALVMATRGKLYVALIGALAFPTAAVFNTAGLSVPLFYAVAALAAVALFAESAQGALPKSRRFGAGLLGLFTGWSVLITAVAPAVFSGVPVLPSRSGIDNALSNPVGLDYTVSNAAQALYLILAVVTAYYLGTRRQDLNRALTGAIGVLVALGFGRLAFRAAGLPWPDGFFDNSTAFVFIDTTAEGLPRFRGIFAEPSDLSAACITAIVYLSFRLPRMKTVAAKVWGAIFIAMAAAQLVSADSGTALVGAIIVAVALFGVVSFRFFLRNGRIPPLAFVAFFFAVAAAAPHIPRFLDFVQTEVIAKQGSQSFSTRTGADEFAIGVLFDTWGLGAGLGSNRPSTLFAMSLSTVGLIGAVLFVALVLVLVRRAIRTQSGVAASWALLSLLVVKSVAGPNLSDPLLWVLLGVTAASAWAQAEAAEHPSVRRRATRSAG